MNENELKKLNVLSNLVASFVLLRYFRFYILSALAVILCIIAATCTICSMKKDSKSEEPKTKDQP